jgi:hypothetical protein
MRGSASQWTKRLGTGAVALLGLGAVALHAIPADAKVLFDVGTPMTIAPPPYYAYAHPASYSPTPSIAGAIFVGFANGHHWQ